MPNIGALVRLKDGRIGIVTAITPLGHNDLVWVGDAEVKITHPDDIQEVLHEPEPT